MNAEAKGFEIVKIRRIFIEENREKAELCPVCQQIGELKYLRYFWINMDEAVYKCSSSACMFPFHNFKYKNFVNNTVYRLEQIHDLPNAQDLEKPQNRSPFMEVPKDDISDEWSDFNGSIYDVIKSSNEIIDNSIGLAFNFDNLLEFTTGKPSVESNSTYDLDGIEGIIDDLCNEANYSQSPPEDTTADYSITDLADYIYSPPKRKCDLSSSPRLIKCLEHIEKTVSDNNCKQNKKENSPKKASIEPKLRNHRKPVKAEKLCGIKSIRCANNPLVAESLSNVNSRIDHSEKLPAKRKTLMLSKLLKQKEDVSSNLKTLVKHKNKFRPLDLLHTLCSMKGLKEQKPAVDVIQPTSLNAPVQSQTTKPKIQHEEQSNHHQSSIKQKRIVKEPILVDNTIDKVDRNDAERLSNTSIHLQNCLMKREPIKLIDKTKTEPQQIRIIKCGKNTAMKSIIKIEKQQQQAHFNIESIQLLHSK